MELSCEELQQELKAGNLENCWKINEKSIQNKEICGKSRKIMENEKLIENMWKIIENQRKNILNDFFLENQWELWKMKN